MIWVITNIRGNIIVRGQGAGFWVRHGSVMIWGICCSWSWPWIRITSSGSSDFLLFCGIRRVVLSTIFAFSCRICWWTICRWGSFCFGVSCGRGCLWRWFVSFGVRLSGAAISMLSVIWAILSIFGIVFGCSVLTWCVRLSTAACFEEFGSASQQFFEYLGVPPCGSVEDYFFPVRTGWYGL